MIRICGGRGGANGLTGNLGFRDEWVGLVGGLDGQSGGRWRAGLFLEQVESNGKVVFRPVKCGLLFFASGTRLSYSQFSANRSVLLHSRFFTVSKGHITTKWINQQQ